MITKKDIMAFPNKSMETNYIETNKDLSETTWKQYEY